ncbi:MAG: glycoside hydrolase family 38 C-terminal domain-containing protein [Kiritimatiellia bacterium]
MKKRKLTAWVVPTTHWDRAWWLPFEVFRARLIDLVDGVLDIMKKDPAYKAFTIDGQSVVLDDYAAIRPERSEDIRREIKAGRLAAGPWYVLPDMYLASGEALIRNLMFGIDTARRFGGAMMAGHVPDPFGFPSMLPAILNGFGLRSLIFSRGCVPEIGRKGIVFRWRGPDGSEVLATRQVPHYGNLRRWGIAHGLPMDSAPDVDAAMSQASGVIRTMKREHLNADVVLLSNGFDHEPAQPSVTSLIAEANRRFGDVVFRQGTYEDYVRDLRKRGGDFPVYSGELHAGWKMDILWSVYSARMWIKQENFACQRTLEQIVEPLYGYLGAEGVRRPAPLIRYAWKELLKNHCHDDICGCSVDAVHEDNRLRFRHVRELSSELINVALNRLSEMIGPDVSRDCAVRILAFNPAPRRRGVEMKADIPEGIPPGKYSAMRLRRADGPVVPMSVKNGEITFYDSKMPPAGYAVYLLEKGRGAEPPSELKASGRVIENSMLRVKIAPCGTVELTDKKTGRQYRGLNTLENTEDVGDEYDYSPLKSNSRTVYSSRSRGRVYGAGVAPGHAEVRAAFSFVIPRSVNREGTARSSRTVSVPVEVTVRLKAGERRVEFTTRVRNRALDHRLRALFPTGLRSRTVRASSHFDIVERPADLTKGTLTHSQSAPGTHHMDEFVAVGSGKRGVLLVSKGLPEYEAVKDKRGVTLALTLLRCVEWLSRGDLVTRRTYCGPHFRTPGAQCPGQYTFEYAFQPCDGDPVGPGAVRSALDYTVPAACAAVPIVSEAENTRHGKRIPPVRSWLKVHCRSAALSAVKPAESGRGLVVRLWHMGKRKTTARLEFCREIESARFARLDETLLDEAAHDGCFLSIPLSRREIATVVVKFSR